jgi:hypothetical protein
VGSYVVDEEKPIQVPALKNQKQEIPCAFPRKRPRARGLTVSCSRSIKGFVTVSSLTAIPPDILNSIDKAFGHLPPGPGVEQRLDRSYTS